MIRSSAGGYAVAYERGRREMVCCDQALQGGAYKRSYAAANAWFGFKPSCFAIALPILESRVSLSSAFMSVDLADFVPAPSIS